MQLVVPAILQNREQAGRLLAEKLSLYRNEHAVVVGIPYGGICVAAEVARMLDLTLEVAPCRRIKHPTDSKKSIGSVSDEDVFINESYLDIPQDYISHQVPMLQSAIRHERMQYYGDRKPARLLYKTVILVDDVLKCSDSMVACLRSIRRQKPLKVIVAVPVASAEAARVIRQEADEIVFLKIEQAIASGRDHFSEFPKVDGNTVKELLQASRDAAEFCH